MNIQQVGSVADNGKFYTPKYFVAKYKYDTDVLLETADKSLDGCREKVLKFHSEYNECIIIVTVEVRNTDDEYYKV